MSDGRDFRQELDLHIRARYPLLWLATPEEDRALADIRAVAEALRVYRRALEDGPERYLEGRPVKPVFRPYA